MTTIDKRKVCCTLTKESKRKWQEHVVPRSRLAGKIRLTRCRSDRPGVCVNISVSSRSTTVHHHYHWSDPPLLWKACPAPKRIAQLSKLARLTDQQTDCSAVWCLDFSWTRWLCKCDQLKPCPAQVLESFPDLADVIEIVVESKAQHEGTWAGQVSVQYCTGPDISTNMILSLLSFFAGGAHHFLIFL